MGLLHSDHWRELEPEFNCALNIDEAVEALGGPDSPHPVVRELLRVKGKLHEVTRSPDAIAEFRARMDGTYEEPRPVAAAPARGVRAPVGAVVGSRNADSVIEAQARQIAELEAKLAAANKAQKPVEAPDA